MLIPDDAFELIRLLGTWQKRQAEEFLREEGISAIEMDIIILVHGSEDGCMELKMIESSLLAPQSTVFMSARRLEEKGLVRMIHSALDRRIRLIELTDKGMLVCGKALENRRKDFEAMTAGLIGAETEILSLLLRKTVATMHASDALKSRGHHQERLPDDG